MQNVIKKITIKFLSWNPLSGIDCVSLSFSLIPPLPHLVKNFEQAVIVFCFFEAN